LNKTNTLKDGTKELIYNVSKMTKNLEIQMTPKTTMAICATFSGLFMLSPSIKNKKILIKRFTPSTNSVDLNFEILLPSFRGFVTQLRCKPVFNELEASPNSEKEIELLVAHGFGINYLFTIDLST
jgi:hypothetical protein